MTGYLAVAIGSALGGLGRYWLGGRVDAHAGSRFPWGTLVVNVSGALLAGLLVGLLGAITTNGGVPFLLLVIGFCGSYTTVSTFSLQTLDLFHSGDHFGALLNVGASLFGTLAGAGAGILMGTGLA